MADIFISHKSERRAAAEHFAEVLKRYGYTVWFDYELAMGEDFAARIEREIREAKALVALWCSRSVASPWVREEVQLARELGILAPVKIEFCHPPVGSRLVRTIDLSAWDGGPRASALDPLIDALEKLTGRDAVIARKSLIEYENAWWNLGSHRPRAMALKAPLEEVETKRFGVKPPPPASPAPAPIHPERRPGERPPKDFALKKAPEPAGTKRIGLNAQPPARPVPPPIHPETRAGRDWERFLIGETCDVDGIEAYIKQYAASEPRWAHRAKKRLAIVNRALREKAAAERAREARYRARGRIRVAAPIARPAGLAWFLPGAGRIEIFKDAEVTPQMVVVPAGEFWMGSKDGEGNEDERPRHKVTIAKPFAVGRYAVTFDEWDAARAEGGVSHDPACQFRGRGRRPVVNVSWDDAQAYIEWLWAKTGQRYRLLSEAEWEYCCRAGTETQYWWGDEISTKQANYDGNYISGKGTEDDCSPKTLPVNSFRPNSWGLYQVHGNVWEWCQDCWNGDYHNAPAGGSAWTAGDGKYRVLRGGSWAGGPETLRPARRLVNSRHDRSDDVGLRVARTLSP